VEGEDYKVKLDVFEGPLDLLLYLIKKDEVDIHTISIEGITKQYLAYMNTFKMLNIDLASEFIVMAANLMYIKSRSLLPKSELPPEEELDEDDPRWELIRQLIEYKKFKDAAGFLSMKETEQEDYFAHAVEKMEQVEMDFTEPLPDVNIFDLIQAFQNVLKRFEEETDLGEIVDDQFTVADKIENLLSLLEPGKSLRFVDLFDSLTSKTEMIVTFLAVLELMKMNQFSIQQDCLLGDIQVSRREL